MATFPTLRTGAVTQYPAQRAITYATEVVRFLDGSEQRFPQYATPLHQWTIQLQKVDESELNQLREFIRVVNGAAGEFSFTDPWDGTVYPSCSFSGDSVAEAWQAPGRCQAKLVVMENRK